MMDNFHPVPSVSSSYRFHSIVHHSVFSLLQSFLNDLCDVEEFHEALQVCFQLFRMLIYSLINPFPPATVGGIHRAVSEGHLYRYLCQRNGTCPHAAAQV